MTFAELADLMQKDEDDIWMGNVKNSCYAPMADRDGIVKLRMPSMRNN